MFKHKGHLASLTKGGPLVSTILQKPGSKLPTIIAYALAKLSRNPLSKGMADILDEVTPNEKSSTDKMEAIVGGYGHTSVTGMGHLTCTLETIPILDSLTFFYLCRLQDGQETSTRYVNFSKGDIVDLVCPPDPNLIAKAQVRYYEILEQQIEGYRKLIEPTQVYLAKRFDIDTIDEKQVQVLKARAFDCLRYLIPLATNTKVGAIQNAREWAKYIKSNLASQSYTQRETGNLLHTLLTTAIEGYTPEADILIRHTDPSESTVRGLLNHIKIVWPGEKIEGEWVKLLDESDIETRLGKLLLPNNTGIEVECDPNLYPLLFEKHTHHNEMGPLFQYGADTVYGALDIGSLKDINRHRSLELFIPFLHEEAEIARAIKETDPSKQFLICPYLDPEDRLYRDYQDALTRTYEAIQGWIGLVEPGPIVNIGAKSLVPQAHLVQYEVSGSLADWSYTSQLRVRNGGHIAYRRWAYDVIKALGYKNPLAYTSLLEKLSQPEVFDRGQFLDRS